MESKLLLYENHFQLRVQQTHHLLTTVRTLNRWVFTSVYCYARFTIQLNRCCCIVHNETCRLFSTLGDRKWQTRN